MKIAVPAEAPGGLDAALSGHFGHCYAFTLIDVEDDSIESVATLLNLGHEQGGCLTPVGQLHNEGVTVLIAGGMGPRPLAGFQQAGIDVYFSEGAPTVRDAVQLLIDGKSRKFGMAQTCGGGGGGCGGHHH